MSDWQTVKLGEVCDLITKGTTPTSVGFEFVETGINFLKVESIDAEGGFLSSKFAHITEACHHALRRSQLCEDDILFSIAGALGRTALVPGDVLPANTNQALAIIRLRKAVSVEPRFVTLALGSGLLLEQIEQARGGVAQQNLSLAQVQDFRIPLPPLPEQRRIVGILDEAMAGIAAAKDHAEQNRQHARALFESHLHAVFSHPGPGSTTVGFSDVCEISSALVDPRLPEHQQLLHVGGANIETKTGELLELKTAEEENLISGKFLFDSSMVLYSKIRPYLMKAARPDFEGLCSADIYPLAPKKGRLARDFLFHLLLTPEFTEYAIAGSARAGMPKVNRDHLFAFRFTLPPVERQKAVARQLDALAAETRRLEGLYERKAAALDELKQSLLHQAFSGQL